MPRRRYEPLPEKSPAERAEELQKEQQMSPEEEESGRITYNASEDPDLEPEGTGPEWGPLGAIAGMSENQEIGPLVDANFREVGEPEPDFTLRQEPEGSPAPVDEKMLKRESYKTIHRYMTSVHPGNWAAEDLVMILDADGLLIDGLRPPKDSPEQERPEAKPASTGPMNWNQAGEHLNKAEREALKTTVAGTPNPTMINVSNLRKLMNKGPLTRRLYDQIMAVPVPEGK